MANLIEFQLWAPYNEEAALIGSFSDWKDIPMEKGNDGHFRTKVELEDGDYQYKFRVRSKSWFVKEGEWITVTDPYATDLDSATENAIIHIKDGKKFLDDYVWKNDDKPLPPDHQLVIYEMHIADFSGGEDDPNPRGKFKHVIEKLDYLCDLGINAIELMPFQEFPGQYSWGYNRRHLFAIESAYGSTADLKRLVDECHGRGIRVIMDGIYNHTESDSPLTQIDYNYWFHQTPKDPEYHWGPEFNYQFYDENLDVFPARKYVWDNVRYWIEEFHFDGIRYDAARQLGNFDFMHWIVNETKNFAGSKPFYNIAEYIPDDPAITNVDGPMDGCWHDGFFHTIREHLREEKFDLEELKDAIDPKRRGYMGITNTIHYIANHDQERSLADLGRLGILDEAAFKRVKLAVALLFTSVGVPLVWMGEEIGEYKEKTLEANKLDWTLLENDLNKGLFYYYKGLINLRKTNGALFTENIDFFHEDAEAKVLAFNRWNDEGSRVAVVVNFSDNYLAGYEVPRFPAQGKWHEWTRDYDVQFDEETVHIDLGEFEAQVFVWQGE